MKPPESLLQVSASADSPSPAPSIVDSANDLSNLVVFYESERMIPRAIRVQREDGAEIGNIKRLLLEITQDRMPKVLEIEK
jgi:hypothetical protein